MPRSHPKPLPQAHTNTHTHIHTSCSCLTASCLEAIVVCRNCSSTAALLSLRCPTLRSHSCLTASMRDCCASSSCCVLCCARCSDCCSRAFSSCSSRMRSLFARCSQTHGHQPACTGPSRQRVPTARRAKHIISPYQALVGGSVLLEKSKVLVHHFLLCLFGLAHLRLRLRTRPLALEHGAAPEPLDVCQAPDVEHKRITHGAAV